MSRKFNLKILIEFTLIKKSIKRVHFVTGFMLLLVIGIPSMFEIYLENHSE